MVNPSVVTADYLKTRIEPGKKVFYDVGVTLLVAQRLPCSTKQVLTHLTVGVCDRGARSSLRTGQDEHRAFR